MIRKRPHHWLTAGSLAGALLYSSVAHSLAIIDDQFTSAGEPRHGDAMLAVLAQSAERPTSDIDALPLGDQLTDQAAGHAMRELIKGGETLISISLTYDPVIHAQKESAASQALANEWEKVKTKDWAALVAAGNEARAHGQDWPASSVSDHVLVVGAYRNGTALGNTHPGHPNRAKRFVIVEAEGVASVKRGESVTLKSAGASSAATATLAGWLDRLESRYPMVGVKTLAQWALDSAAFDELPTPSVCKPEASQACLSRYYGRGMTSWERLVRHAEKSVGDAQGESGLERPPRTGEGRPICWRRLP